MKRILITTAVAIALGAPLSVSAQLVPPVVGGNSDADDQFGALDNTSDSRGVINYGGQNVTPNSPTGSYSPVLVGSQNASLTNAYNDLNTDNDITIGEDGIVAFAQDLDQAVASSDLSHDVGSALALHGISFGNQITENGVVNAGGQNPAPLTSMGNAWAKTNEISGGSFNNYGGIASASQNAGHSTAMGQSVVVQSNGGI